jgi:DNA-binding HxlR family transcriptional regulator
MKRTSLGMAECPVARALDAIGDWWSLLIIRDAFDGIRRFSEFQRSLGISKGILTTRLKHLVSLGILETSPLTEDSGYQEYVLTAKGRDLFLVTVSLRQWGESHCFEKAEAHSMLVEIKSGRQVERLALRSKEGRSVDSSATYVRKLSDSVGAAKSIKRKNKMTA